MSFARSKGLIFRYIRALARKFRAFQETWLMQWWGGGKAAAVPLWALDILVLVVKLCSTCAMAMMRILIPPTMKSLYGETVLITDTGRALGRELAIQFAELGATVICWDSDVHRNSTLVNDIRNKDGECIGFTVDLTARDQVSTLASRMRGLTDVSIVISNAGSWCRAQASNLPPDAFVRLLELNLLAHFWIIQAFLPSMIERRRGHIVAINSSAGLVPCSDMAPYCAAMFGLRGLMDSITEELRLDTWTKNINTTSVYLACTSADLHPPTSNRFQSYFKEITPKEAAGIIINGKDGIRKNEREISIPKMMKPLISIHNVLPYHIRIIFTDFFNFDHRGWFSYC